MNHSELFARSWQIVWRNKFTLVLGILIAALSGAAGENPLLRILLTNQLPNMPQLPISPILALPGPETLLRWLLIQSMEFGIPGLIALFLLVFIILILVGVVVIVSRGGLIAAAATLDADEQFTLGTALYEGWRKAWRLIIIATIPPIPITIAAIIAVLIAIGMLLANGGSEFLSTAPEVQQRVISLFMLISIALACPFAIITFILSALSHLADRACMLEDARAVPAFRRGWVILRANAGSALILLIFQLAITFVSNILLILPRIAASLFFPMIPLLWIAVGIMQTYFITLWTLAWQRWTHPNN